MNFADIYTEPDHRITSLTIDNIHVCRVGEVLEALREAGFGIEINITPPMRETNE